MNVKTGEVAIGYPGGSEIAMTRPLVGGAGFALYKPLDSTGNGPDPDTFHIQWRDLRAGRFVLVQRGANGTALIDSFAGVFHCDSVIGTSWHRGRAHRESLEMTSLPF